MGQVLWIIPNWMKKNTCFKLPTSQSSTAKPASHHNSSPQLQASWLQAVKHCFTELKRRIRSLPNKNWTLCLWIKTNLLWEGVMEDILEDQVSFCSERCLYFEVAFCFTELLGIPAGILGKWHHRDRPTLHGVGDELGSAITWEKRSACPKHGC